MLHHTPLFTSHGYGHGLFYYEHLSSYVVMIFPNGVFTGRVNDICFMIRKNVHNHVPGEGLEPIILSAHA